MKTFKRIVIFVVVLSIFSFVLPQTSLAIGQMTKPIVIENVLRSQEVTAILYLVNSGDKELTYQLKTEGEIANWASFYKIDDENLENPITEILISPQSKIEAVVKFTIPQDTPNGEYTGEVVIISAPTKDKETGKMIVSVSEMIGREVSITVTDKEIIKFETTIIPLKYGVANGEPLKIKVIYDNQGNVSIKPDIQLKITQISTGKIVQNVIYPYPENETAVKPFERREFPNLIEWLTAGQENGKYRAEIKVLLNGKVIEEESFRFDIGVDIMALLLASIANLFGGNLTLAWFVIGGIILLIAGILALVNKRPELLKAGITKIKSIF